MHTNHKTIKDKLGSVLAEYFISECEIEKLLAEAKAEALEIVKAELRTVMADIARENILDKIACEPQCSARTQDFSASSVEETNSVEERLPMQETDLTEDTLREIEQIQSRIARNEELLRQAKAQMQSPGNENQVDSGFWRKSDFPTEGEGLYVYCVTNKQEHDICSEIDIKGIDGQNPVLSINSKELSAIASRVPLAEFNEAEITQKAENGDLSWFEDKSRHHEVVIRSVMEKDTVIPMKFCTIYTSEESILQFLEEHKNELRESLDYFAGKSEWGVKVYCDTKKFAENSKQQYDEEMTEASGAAYFTRRKQDIAVEKELRKLMSDMSQEIYDRLAKFAVESRSNELLHAKATDKEEPMILNATYLINQSELEAFNNELSKIQQEQQPLRCELETSGPWPPYNFVSF